MAGDWIKMRTNLQRNPRVIRMASALNADRLRVVGGLHAVWSIADEQTEDGRLPSYTFAVIDEMIAWPGFCEVLASVDWITQDAQGVVFPRFDEHNGASAKRRAQESDRKRSARESAKTSAPNADKKRTREEKRREEKDIPPGKRAVPDDWSPADTTIATLSREFGLRVPEDVDRYVAAFRDACAANGYTYKNFDAAFRNCVRQDWPRFRNGRAPGAPDPTAGAV